MSALQSDLGGDFVDDLVTAAVSEIVERRAVIEQTKGMLMFVCGVDATQAFELLRQQSQHHNVPLRLLARQLSADLVELSQSTGGDRRAEAERLLRTAHQRVRTPRSVASSPRHAAGDH